MQKKEDLRVRRTKKALFDAFKNLLCEKPFDDITINNLCERAEIRRATFYKHYTDKYDFITAYTVHLRDRFDQVMKKTGTPALSVEYYVEYSKFIVNYVNQNEKMIENIFISNLFPSVMFTIVDQNYRDTCDRLKVSEASGMKLCASPEVLASMCSGGVATTIYRWINNGKKLDANELEEQIAAVVAAILEPNNNN